MSEDNTNNFIGAKLIDVKITDTLLKSNGEFDVWMLVVGSGTVGGMG